jgi:hypothetical protein
MSYEEKAFEIVKESIKSAIFIDEKARTFYQDEKELKGEDEEKLSIELYNNLKENGISLDIHKYNLKDENDDDLKNYLFEDRDLVLLDWNLQGDSGEEHSLKLLEDIVNRPHIHFCAIYTSESGSKLDSVFFNILSYFSSEDEKYYTDLKEKLESIENIDSIVSDLNFINVYRDSKLSGERFQKIFKENRATVETIFEQIGKDDKKCSLIKASIALMDTRKSLIKNACPNFVSFDNKTIVIDNTIIVILNKKDNNPNVLISNLSKQITKHENSFTQLLGLEMQTIFSKTSAFIDQNLLHFSKDALLYHRENYRKDGLLHFFPEFIKEIMLEKARLNIRSIPISLLDNDFLDIENKSVMPNDKELIAMNVFYNSTKLKNDNKLNFGDVFKKDDVNEFFICITALCDCLRPDKIQNSFFFAKGAPIKIDDALRLGDTAFISYLSEKQVVKWTDVNTLIEDRHQMFSPIYIKPLQFCIVNTEFDSNESLQFTFLNSTGVAEVFNAKYITTIKSNYTQRIANHAFSYPIRVGVDFVKK